MDNRTGSYCTDCRNLEGNTILPHLHSPADSNYCSPDSNFHYSMNSQVDKRIAQRPGCYLLLRSLLQEIQLMLVLWHHASS